MTAAELRLYFQAWCESRDEVERLAAMEPSPAVDLDYARAQANEFYDRMNYRRLRREYEKETGHAPDDGRCAV